MPIFDFWSIFFAVVIDVVMDLIVFKLFGVKGVTVVITLILNFLIPYFSFMFYVWSRSPINEEILALGDYIGNTMVNLVNYSISAVFGYVITAIIFVFSGGRTERPDLQL
jgi:hypothetical protein